MELTDPEQDEHRRQVVWPIPDAPVTISLPEPGRDRGGGPGDIPRAAGRWLVAQAAVLHSPSDLRFYLLTDSSGKASWEWARWLPHCRPDAGQDCAMLIGNDAESVATRIAELLAIIAARQQAARDAGPQEARFRPDIVVVFDGSRKLRALPGTIQVLQDGPQVGVYAICLDTDERLLPAECQAVVVVEGDRVRVQQAMAATCPRSGRTWCRRTGAPSWPGRSRPSATSATAMRPRCCRTRPGCWTCWRWNRRPPWGSRAAGGPAAGPRWPSSASPMTGRSASTCSKDGPHALIAGTTGSGKSELLQTIVASLAVANRPDEMTFVLVDYKGGSAFADCARLPHTVGMVTDLDPHQVERALASLSAELTRREHILAAAGAKDIEDYQLLVDKRRRPAAAAAGHRHRRVRVHERGTCPISSPAW